MIKIEKKDYIIEELKEFGNMKKEEKPN